jgi:hypothetical protein
MAAMPSELDAAATPAELSKKLRRFSFVMMSPVEMVN